MKTIQMTNPTTIEGVEEYRELFWIPSLDEHRQLLVWRDEGDAYAYLYEANGEERYATGLASGQLAYEAGMAAVNELTPDAEAPLPDASSIADGGEDDGEDDGAAQSDYAPMGSLGALYAAHREGR